MVQQVKITLVVFLLLCINNCSAQKMAASADNKKQNIDNFTKKLLPLVEFTGSLVKAETRFVGYSKTAGRVTIIDATSETEVINYKITGNYIKAFEVGNFAGVGLLDSENLLILGEGGQREFSHQMLVEESEYAVAKNGAAFAFVNSEDTAKLKIVRYLGKSEWEEKEPIFNWETANTNIVPLWNNDGTSLLVLRTDNGGYTMFKASSEDQSIGEAVLVCEFTPKIVEHSLYYWTTGFLLGDLVFLGSRLGEVSVFSLAAPERCEDPVKNIKFKINDQPRIIRMSTNLTGELYVTSPNLLTILDSISLVEKGQHEIPCSIPLETYEMEDRLIIPCLDIVQDTDDPENYHFRAANLSSYDKEQNQVKRVFDLNNEKEVSYTLDVTNKKLFSLYDQSLGKLVIKDLTTGIDKTKNGIFIKNILTE